MKQITTKRITRPEGMSQKTFESMIVRNGMTGEKIQALREGLERGRQLIESSKKLIEGRKLS